MKKKLLLLHGALGSAQQFDTLITLLEKTYEVFTCDFEGHGTGQTTHRHYRIEHFAENVHNFIKDNSLQSCHIIGYSMGGYVGLYCARHYPELIESVITLGTKFFWSADYAMNEIKKLQPEIIQAKVPAFAQILEKRHAKHEWKNVLANTAEMMVHLGNTKPLTSEDIQMITARLSIGVAEKDITVSVDETEKLARCNPQSEFYVLPGSFHPLEKIRTALWASIITDFIER